jgi:hypothetical protein
MPWPACETLPAASAESAPAPSGDEENRGIEIDPRLG